MSVSQEGMTRVRERFVISAPVSGQVERITLEAGDPVVAGRTVLATVDAAAPALLDARTSAEARAQVKAGGAEFAPARA